MTTPREDEVLARLRRYKLYETIAADARCSAATRSASAAVAKALRTHDGAQDAHTRVMKRLDNTYRAERDAWKALVAAYAALDAASSGEP